jgi:site-specific recombinase XerD
MLCKIIIISYARGLGGTTEAVADETTRERAVGSEGLTADADGGPWLGDAIHFFLSAKRAGGRSPRTVDDYRKKLELFQRWIARRLGGDDAVDAPYTDIGADEVEAYVVYLRDGRSMADSSRKNHLAVLRSFFQTVSGRMRLPDPLADLDEVRFHQRAPKRSYLTKREADILLSAVEKLATHQQVG